MQLGDYAFVYLFINSFVYLLLTQNSFNTCFICYFMKNSKIFSSLYTNFCWLLISYFCLGQMICDIFRLYLPIGECYGVWWTLVTRTFVAPPFFSHVRTFQTFIPVLHLTIPSPSKYLSYSLTHTYPSPPPFGKILQVTLNGFQPRNLFFLVGLDVIWPNLLVATVGT